MAEIERASNDSRNNPAKGEDCVRHLSRKGTYNTITFPNDEHMPPCFDQEPPVPPPRKVQQLAGALCSFSKLLTKVITRFGAWYVCLYLSLLSQVCAITGLPAKYMDPLTQCAYATIDAFRELRRQHNLELRGI